MVYPEAFVESPFWLQCGKWVKGRLRLEERQLGGDDYIKTAGVGEMDRSGRYCGGRVHTSCWIRVIVGEGTTRPKADVHRSGVDNDILHSRECWLRDRFEGQMRSLVLCISGIRDIWKACAFVGLVLRRVICSSSAMWIGDRLEWKSQEWRPLRESRRRTK